MDECWCKFCWFVVAEDEEDDDDDDDAADVDDCCCCCCWADVYVWTVLMIKPIWNQCRLEELIKSSIPSII